MGHSFPQASKGKMSYAFLRDLWLQKKAFLSYIRIAFTEGTAVLNRESGTCRRENFCQLLLSGLPLQRQTMTGFFD